MFDEVDGRMRVSLLSSMSSHTAASLLAPPPLLPNFKDHFPTASPGAVELNIHLVKTPCGGCHSDVGAK